MISVRHTKKRKDKKAQGLTLPELLIAGLISLMTAYVAGDALLSHLRGAERAESLEQQRENWARAAAFIEADIALSERIFDLQTNPSALTIPSACSSYIDPDNPEEQLRLGLEQNKLLTPVIYFIRTSDTGSGWLPDRTLWRCGPSINMLGESESGTVQVSQILDGLDRHADGEGFKIFNLSSNGKQTSFSLALKGHALNTTYLQEDATQARISPLFIRPNEYSYCVGNAFVKVEGSAGADTLMIQVGQIAAGEDILICGRGGGDTITGSNLANDILEAGDTGGSSISGLSGNDVLRGTDDDNNPDILNGGNDDDILIGRRGFDLLNGGCGTNQYLPGLGADTIYGDGNDYEYQTNAQGDFEDSNDDGIPDINPTPTISGVCGNTPPFDIVFFEKTIESYTVSCTNQNCIVTEDNNPSNKNTLNAVEILIFSNARRDLSPPP